MEKLELAISSLSLSPSETEEFRTALFVDNHKAISEYIFNNNATMLNNIIDELSLSFLTVGLKTSFKNDLS